MADDTLRTFPENEIEALAMLYIQNQDLSEVTPEVLFDMYEEAYKKIKAYSREKHGRQRQSISF